MIKQKDIEETLYSAIFKEKDRNPCSPYAIIVPYFAKALIDSGILNMNLEHFAEQVKDGMEGKWFKSLDDKFECAFMVDNILEEFKEK